MNPDQHNDSNNQPPAPSTPAWQAPSPEAPQPPAAPFAPADTPMPGAAPAHQPWPADQPTTPPPAPSPVPDAQPVPPASFPAPPSEHQPWSPPAHHPASTGHSPQSDKGGKLLIIIASVVAGLVAVLVGSYFLLFSGSNNPIGNITSSITGSADVVDRPDGTLNLQPLIVPSDTVKNQDLQGKLNQQINLSSGMSYMITKVDRNYTSTARFLQPGRNKELVKVSIVVGSRKKTGDLYLGSSFLTLINSANGEVLPEFASPDEVTDAFQGGSIASGKQVKGVLIYEVDKDEKINGFSTEDEYVKISNQEHVKIKTRVNL